MPRTHRSRQVTEAQKRAFRTQMHTYLANLAAGLAANPPQKAWLAPSPRRGTRN